MMDKLQLMEITQTNTQLGVDFGICCTAQAVGRAKVLTLLESEHGGTMAAVDRSTIVNDEPLMAIVVEHFDDPESTESRKDAYRLAKEVVDLIAVLSMKEQEIISKGTMLTDVCQLILDLSNDDDDETKLTDVADLIADLPENARKILSEGNDDDREEYDDEEEETRQDRFQQVFL